MFKSRRLTRIIKKLISHIFINQNKSIDYYISTLLKRNKNQCAYFIQIGSNNGKDNDPLYKYVIEGKIKGILIEPVSHIFEDLKKTYQDCQDLIFENVAISTTNGRQKIYRLNKTNNNDLPNWYEQLASFNKDVVLKHRDKIKDIDSLLIEEEVICKTLNSIITTHHYLNVDIIHIDTEGYDYEVLKTIPFDKISPSLIIYEYKHLSKNDKEESISLLKSLGFNISELRVDIVAYKR